MNQNVILALETGIGGGSLSLFVDGEEIDFWKGEKRVSKAEDLLVQISGILKDNNISKKSIKTIFVSKGPGSFTGLRIGLSTARGLQKALGCECYGINVLEAMLLKATAAGITVAAVSSGRDKLWVQVFKVVNPDEIVPETMPFDIRRENLIEIIEEYNEASLIFEAELSEEIERKLNLSNLQSVKIDYALSKFIGLRGISNSFNEEAFTLFYQDEGKNR